ncbi:MAG: PleD family two-component system response regulator [Candidatus Hermodarchaeota archaeon]
MEDSKYDILIIDDSKYIEKLLTIIIKSKGYSCKAVESTYSAMKELEAHIPKLILLDVNLPDSNGYDFCKMLKSSKKFNKILVYYFTGVTETEIAVKALETNADGYLKKPFDLSDFNDIFDQIKQYSIA